MDENETIETYICGDETTLQLYAALVTLTPNSHEGLEQAVNLLVTIAINNLNPEASPKDALEELVDALRGCFADALAGKKKGML